MTKEQARERIIAEALTEVDEDGEDLRPEYDGQIHPHDDPVYNREAFTSDAEWLEACFAHHGDEEFHPVDQDVINHLAADERAQAEWRATRVAPRDLIITQDDIDSIPF